MYLEEKLKVDTVSPSNSEAVNSLLHIIDKHYNWGFGLGHFYLRNVKGFKWDQKYECRIYKELDLNLRIKPGKILVREKSEVLAVPQAINLGGR